MEHDERIARDRWLRAAALRGDRDAWQRWVDESFAGLQSFVRWRCGGDARLSDDIVQETWLVAVREIRRYDPLAAPFPAWLRGVAENLIRNQLRRQRVRAAASLDWEPTSPGGGPSQRLEDREHAARVAAALAALPPRYEAALRAKYVDGRTVHEIARLAGITNKNVESLLSRARAAFRRLYRDPDATIRDRQPSHGGCDDECDDGRDSPPSEPESQSLHFHRDEP